MSAALTGAPWTPYGVPLFFVPEVALWYYHSSVGGSEVVTPSCVVGEFDEVPSMSTPSIVGMSSNIIGGLASRAWDKEKGRGPEWA